MKNPAFRSGLMALSLILIACSEESEEQGSLIGSVGLIDNYSTESFIFSDVQVKITDSNQNATVVHLDASGNYEVNNVRLGKVEMLIEKPQYIGVTLNNIQNSAGVDTIPKVTLVEEIPFSYSSFFVSYRDGWLTHSESSDYMTDETFLVGHYICFGKEMDVSSKEYQFVRGGGFTSVGLINSVGSQSSREDINLFLSNGFQAGDRIFAVNYAVGREFSRVVYEQRQTLEDISYSLNNPSPVSSFILE